MSNLVFCCMGPTASGKTALATQLVATYPFEIISVDSAMIYRNMDIGTAKPSVKELRITPHHLIDILDPNESYSAAQFCSDARALCESIFKRGKIPLLTGGTMMYFNALQQGLSTLPQADASIRKRLEDEAKQLGLEALHRQLHDIDPTAAARIHAHDAQRIQRALEVYYLTGTPLTELLAQQTSGSDYRFVNFSLFPEQRSWLHERIELRFDQMLADGFVDEVKRIQEQWDIDPNAPSMRCVGYRQVLEYLQGEIDASTMRDKGIAATRQLAKRQLTWLRHWPDTMVFDPQISTFSEEIIAKTREILDNGFL